MEKSIFPPTHYALIAAGEGSRLREEGISVPKPLVQIQGQPMIERLIRIFLNNGAKSISVICNEQMKEVRDFLFSLKGSELLKSVDEQGETCVCPLNIVVKNTPSSMHSLAALTDVIPEGKFCLTTVDTIFSEAEFSSFIRIFAADDSHDADGFFAVTTFVDDEKPLWVGVNPQKTFSCACEKAGIVGFYDRKDQIPAMAEARVSGGIYCLDTRTAFPVLNDCLAQGQSRMRNYQRALVSAGLKLEAYTFSKIMDIDHASDIEKAEAWLASSSRRLLAIARDTVYSPNNEAKDAAIWQSTLNILREHGWQVKEVTESEWTKTEVKTLSDRYDKIVHMARRMQSLMRLEQAPIPVFNMPKAVRVVAKSRELTLTLLQQAGIPVPDWWAYDPEEDEMFMCEPHLQQLLPAWVKGLREDGTQPADVQFVTSPLEADTCVLQLSSENVPDIVVTQHVEGPLLKCYTVLSAQENALPRLLRWFWPQECGYSKFGEAETHNSPLEQTSVNESLLSQVAMKIGQALGLQIFGFDAIVQPDGNIVVIDVNDWPSFSVCREEAAKAIASVIEEQITETK